MKNILISRLRDETTSIEDYRMSAWQLATVLAIESSNFLPKEKCSIKTPMAPAEGVCLKKEVVLVPILRSGLVLLDPFLKFYPKSLVGFIGTRRDEKTATADLYYVNLPKFKKDPFVFLLDPMIATGGSASLSIKILKEANVLESKIALVSFFAASEGMARLKKEYPYMHILVAQVDENLDDKKRIVPGLGDFGDRYFGE